jgi:hypothetical protein
MYVLRHLTHGDSMGHFTTGLAQDEAAPDVIRRLALQVGQREIRLAVASIGRAQQGEKSLVLIDWQELAVASGPALRGEIEAKDSDFGQKRFSHSSDSLYFWRSA